MSHIERRLHDGGGESTNRETTPPGKERRRHCYTCEAVTLLKEKGRWMSLYFPTLGISKRVWTIEFICSVCGA
jgi:hypothetical protein